MRSPIQDPYTEFLSDNPEPGGKTMELNKEAQKLLEENKLKQAEKKLRKALSIFPLTVPAKNNLALIYYLREDYKKAISEAEEVIVHYPDHIFALCTLAASHFKLGEKERAESYIETAMRFYNQKSPKMEYLEKIVETLSEMEDDYRLHRFYLAKESENFSPLSLFRIGVAEANLKHWNRAERLWERVMDMESDWKFLESFLFSAKLIKEKRVPLFRFEYRVRREKGKLDILHPPPNVKAFCVDFIFRGTDKLQEGAFSLLTQYPEPWAEEALRWILRDPLLRDRVKMEAGMCLVEKGALKEGEPIHAYMKGKLREIIMQKKKIPGKPPPEAVEEFERGMEYRREGDPERAEECYKRAIELHPIFSSAMVNLANIYRTKEKFEEAEDLLLEALNIDPTPLTRFNLAGVYLEKGDIEEAEEILKEIKPEDMKGELAKFYSFWGLLYMSKGEFPQALDAFEKALSYPSSQAVREKIIRDIEFIKKVLREE